MKRRTDPAEQLMELEMHQLVQLGSQQQRPTRYERQVHGEDAGLHT